MSSQRTSFRGRTCSLWRATKEPTDRRQDDQGQSQPDRSGGPMGVTVVVGVAMVIERGARDLEVAV